MIISVIGGEGAPPEANRMAEEVGRELAKRGVTVCCGGGGGIMEAVCRGARSEGGHTIGILPGRDASESPPNAWVEFPVFTGIGYARNAAVVLTGDAVIAVDGAYGTLSEIAYAMIHDVPLVGLDTWDFEYHGHDAERITRVSTPVEAVEKAIELAQRPDPDRGPAK
ncbi:MAG: TIGR00725 family protein [Dehalococcoidia bacterium]|nr:TIGR00725 family protein [Dehalococcoidia bacterium]